MTDMGILLSVTCSYGKHVSALESALSPACPNTYSLEDLMPVTCET